MRSDRSGSSSELGDAARAAPGWPWVVSALALGIVGIVIATGWGGERTATTLTDAAAVVTALGGAVVLLRPGHGSGRPSTPWRLLGVAMALWGLGEVLWGWDEVVLGREVPFPSIADVAYLAAVPFAVAGLLAFARGTRARVRVRTVLDGCLVTSSLLFITWALVLGPVWRSDAGGGWANAISVAYPVTDLVLAVLALVLVQWSGSGQRAALRTVAAGLLVMAFTDSAFTWLTNEGTYSSTNPISLLWPASYLIVAYASTRTDASGSSHREGAEPLGSLVTPYVPLLGAIAVAIPRVVDGQSLGPFLTVNGGVLLTLVLARQALTAWDLRTTVAALHEREHQLERMAHADPLTGLANRASFAARLEALVATPGLEPAVVYIDLDGFKAINDRFGHATGDDLLVEVAQRLSACTDAGTGTLLARLGGDEFVVLVEAGQTAAVALARTVLRAFELPFHHEGEDVPFRASLGIASAPAGAGPEEAVRRADAAMYVAKAAGKGRAVAYPDEDLVGALAD